MRYDPEAQIARTKELLDQIADAQQIGQFRAIWRDVLANLQRMWEHYYKACRKEPWFEAHSAQYEAMRSDKKELLYYLRMARNEEEHSFSGSLNSSWNVFLQEKLGRPFRLSDGEIRIEDGKVTFDLHSPDDGLELDFKVGWDRPEVMSFRNDRGKKVPLPRRHMGRSLHTRDPVVMATMALDCYSGMLRSAQHEMQKK